MGKSYPKEFNICNVKTISQNKHQNFCLSILKFRVSFLKKKKMLGICLYLFYWFEINLVVFMHKGSS